MEATNSPSTEATPAVRPLATVREREAPASDQTKIEIRNLSFFYGETKALSNINMNIPENQVTALIGPSGCGKSTLLRNLTA